MQVIQKMEQGFSGHQDLLIEKIVKYKSNRMQICKKLLPQKYNRLMVYLLFSLVCFGISTISAQEKKLVMGSNSLTIEQIFNKIEEQTGDVFAYSKRDFQMLCKMYIMRELSMCCNGLPDTLHAESINQKVMPLAPPILKDTIIQARKETIYLDSSPGLIEVGGKNELRPRYALKTNGLYLATTTPNISFEAALAKKWTLQATLGYNPWNFSSGKIQHGLAMAEARYWTCKSFERHFFGIHGVYSEFNVGELQFISSMENYTYNGNLYGGGISYGYHFPLKGRWGVELTAGLGYIHFNYNKYECIGCRELLGSYKRDYWGPNKAGISLIYMIE